MQKAKLLLTGLTFLGTAALAGCSLPGVYKIDIQQGNVITQDMIDQLRPGMTRNQVRFVMGNPLITDTFHANRWDYLYSLQAGGGARQQERIALIFDEQGLLTGLSGDFLPGMSRPLEAPDATPATAERTVPQQSAPASPAGEPERPSNVVQPGSLLEEIQREVDEVQRAPVPSPEKLD
ncbi:outer membrane protein assembly factor BamE [Pseudomonas sp. NW5]|uniref:outer membrane protein assembly factor BamE n=1 Tax=Pseudomonas sp. NW5 TaxID=2934934 RepID=UPI0020205E9D|nr:outer membrane protein assembly factor BamE [Pseudomonas sp. NW5]MCL7461952.1 outer membrane protein assembly factor BamE [Pseudomonas sp. NW5]